MTLFHAKDAADSVKVHRAERAATKDGQHFATSPFGQRLIAENKQLRSALHRIGALEKRMDDTEFWQTEAQSRIENATKLGSAAIVLTGLDHHEDCPCGKRQTWTGPHRCYHCRESFDTPAEMEFHTSTIHHQTSA